MALAEAGIQLSLVALWRDEVILALFRGQAGHDQVYAVGLVMDKADMAEVRARLGRDASLAADEQAYLEFVDPFGPRWQISTDRRFRTCASQRRLTHRPVNDRYPRKYA